MSKTFSLRSLFVLMTAAAVLLAVLLVVDRQMRLRYKRATGDWPEATASYWMRGEYP